MSGSGSDADSKAAETEFFNRYHTEDTLSDRHSRIVKARRVDWKPEDWRDVVINCQQDGDGHTVCTTLGGENVGVFPIPLGEQPYDMWVADELIKSRNQAQEQLRLLDPTGCIFCTKKIGDELVAMKTIRNEDKGVRQDSLREIAMLKQLNHRNIVRLLDVFCAPEKTVLVFELLETDLQGRVHRLKKRNNFLSPDVVKSLMKQLTAGIEHVHASGIIHRHLQTSNLLIDKDDNLKIGDFGLAREAILERQNTHDVCNMWFRPPEILLGCKIYCRAVDMWGCGCILAEMASGQPLFHGDCEIDTIFQIFRILGTPTEEQGKGLRELPDFKQTFPKWQKKAWLLIRNLSAQLGQAGLELLDALLTYDPAERTSARAALQLDYLSGNGTDTQQIPQKRE